VGNEEIASGVALLCRDESGVALLCRAESGGRGGEESFSLENRTSNIERSTSNIEVGNEEVDYERR